MKQPKTSKLDRVETVQPKSLKLNSFTVSDVSDKRESINAPSGIRIAVLTLILAASSFPGCAGRIGFGPKESKDISALLDRKDVKDDIKASKGTCEHENISEHKPGNIPKEEIEEARKSLYLAEAYIAYASIVGVVRKELNAKPINPANLQSLLLRLTKIEDIFIKQKPLKRKAEKALIELQNLIRTVKFALDKK